MFVCFLLIHPRKSAIDPVPHGIKLGNANLSERVLNQFVELKLGKDQENNELVSNLKTIKFNTSFHCKILASFSPIPGIRK